jgi:hypothetical protein
MARIVPRESPKGGHIRIFKSSEQTGTASAQNIAHGLNCVPDVVLLIPTNGLTTATTLVEGSHTVTNVVATVSTGAKYVVVAIAM